MLLCCVIALLGNRVMSLLMCYLQLYLFYAFVFCFVFFDPDTSKLVKGVTGEWLEVLQAPDLAALEPELRV